MTSVLKLTSTFSHFLISPKLPHRHVHDCACNIQLRASRGGPRHMTPCDSIDDKRCLVTSNVRSAVYTSRVTVSGECRFSECMGTSVAHRDTYSYTNILHRTSVVRHMQLVSSRVCCYSQSNRQTVQLVHPEFNVLSTRRRACGLTSRRLGGQSLVCSLTSCRQPVT